VSHAVMNDDGKLVAATDDPFVSAKCVVTGECSEVVNNKTQLHNNTQTRV